MLWLAVGSQILIVLAAMLAWRAGNKAERREWEIYDRQRTEYDAAVNAFVEQEMAQLERDLEELGL